MLHIISKKLQANDSLFLLLQQSAQPCTLIFYGEGCYNITLNTLQALPSKHKLLVLDTDLKARGLTTNAAQTITMDEFVQHVFNAPNNTSWF